MGRSRDPYLEKMLRAVPLLPILLGPMVMRHSVLSAIVIAVTSFALWHAVRTAKEGRSIVLTTHALDEAQELCARVASVRGR